MSHAGQPRGRGQIPDPIQWHEGMMLCPQHFQQESLRVDAVLAGRTRVLAPLTWGVTALKLETDGLERGVLRLSRIEAVLPDGYGLSYDASLAAPLEGEAAGISVQLDPNADSPAGARIYVGVPALKTDGRAVDRPGARYRSYVAEGIVDLNTGTGELEVPRLRQNLALHTPALPSGWVGFPIARARCEDGKFTLLPFSPATPILAPESAIGRQCVALAARIRNHALRQAERAEKLESRGEHLMAARAHRSLEVLVGDLTGLEALLDMGRAHPFRIFLALATMLGRFAALVPGRVPLRPPPYDHANLLATFQPVIAELEGLLEAGSKRHFERQIFHSTRDPQGRNVFVVDLREDWQGRPLILAVWPRDGVSDEETRHWVESCLIGSASLQEQMLDRRVLGLRRRPMDGAGELAPSSDALLYELAWDSRFVEPEQTLVCFNTGELDQRFRPAQLGLYVRVGAAQGGGSRE